MDLSAKIEETRAALQGCARDLLEAKQRFQAHAERVIRLETRLATLLELADEPQTTEAGDGD